ncbi:hypothetical protein ACFOG5_22150 [Pedobacter fastidiosus]|uniref:hypothetical protein n=1 Tax=Pedobacter fastidiosus TaxID=2765361 RepID=UPI00361B247E
MKNVFGGGGVTPDPIGDRCRSDYACVFTGTDGLTGGGCATMQTGQCRCVAYNNGVATQSVPSSACLN